MEVLVFPTGAKTAGVLLGASKVIREVGNAVKMCNGESPGQFIIGGVPCAAFSVTILLLVSQKGATRD